MHRRLDIIIALLIAIAVLLVANILTGCTTTKGLHSENRYRNAKVHRQMKSEHKDHFIR